MQVAMLPVSRLQIRGNVILFNASGMYPGYINFITKEGDLVILDASFAYLDASSMYSQKDNITPIVSLDSNDDFLSHSPAANFALKSRGAGRLRGRKIHFHGRLWVDIWRHLVV